MGSDNVGTILVGVCLAIIQLTGFWHAYQTTQKVKRDLEKQEREFTITVRMEAGKPVSATVKTDAPSESDN